MFEADQTYFIKYDEENLSSKRTVSGPLLLMPEKIGRMKSHLPVKIHQVLTLWQKIKTLERVRVQCAGTEALL